MTAMHKLSAAVAGAGLALLQLVSLPALAAPPVQLAVQILDPSGACASWTTGGTVLAPTITCNAATPPAAGAPTGCQGTASPSSVAASGGAVTLGVTGCNPANASLGAWQTSLGGATILGNTLTVPSYTGSFDRPVVATIQACSPTDATACVQVNAQTTQVAPTTPPPTGGNLFPANGCSGFTTTLTQAFEWTTAGNMVVDTQRLGNGMGSNGVLLATFVTPAAQGTDANMSINVAEYPAGSGTAVERSIRLSTSPCEFNQGIGRDAAPSTYSLKVALGPSGWGFPSLLPNTRYYVNVANTSFGRPTCPSGSSCNLRLEITKPSGF